MRKAARFADSPLPDEPKSRKRGGKRHVRSDHRHVYEEVRVFSTKLKHKSLWRAWRCSECGRVKDIQLWMPCERSDGMPIYGVESFFPLKALTDDMLVSPDEWAQLAGE